MYRRWGQSGDDRRRLLWRQIGDGDGNIALIPVTHKQHTRRNGSDAWDGTVNVVAMRLKGRKIGKNISSMFDGFGGRSRSSQSQGKRRCRAILSELLLVVIIRSIPFSSRSPFTTHINIVALDVHSLLLLSKKCWLLAKME